MVQVGVSGRNRMSFAPGVSERLLEVTETFGKGLKMGGGKRNVILVGDIGGTHTPISLEE